MRETGVVKWFTERGFGFIINIKGGPDLYVHFSQINVEGRTLKEGQQVSFIAVRGKKGMEAHDVQLI
jgi:CspA family cold shock protein